MDKLKREWRETQIPAEIKLQARNLAWAKMQRPAGRKRALGWAAAASTVVAIAALILIWSGRDPRIDQVVAPAPQHVSPPAAAANQTTNPHVATQPALNPKPFREHIVSKRERAQAEEPERIVLNFTLPESGARMIWIIDSNFRLNGGVE
jgi:hypothetical protein